MKLLEELAVRSRFGMKPGLDVMRSALSAAGNPERHLGKVVHVAGTNGKGAVCAMLDACLSAAGRSIGRYTSPHLVRINERFFLNGAPVADEVLDEVSARVISGGKLPEGLTYFEMLTLVAFVLYGRERPDWTILETGLGGRLDATNVCLPELCIITRIGLDHCDWLGDTVEKIAAEKAGIIKPGVPIVLGANLPAVREVVAARAAEVGAPFQYAPMLVREEELPPRIALGGTFNRENAITALAALRVVGGISDEAVAKGMGNTVWPGRFQRVGGILVDGAHNPPAARALAEALSAEGVGEASLDLVCGFCGDKDALQVLRLLAPFVRRGFAVRTNNPRSLSAEDTARLMTSVGIRAEACESLAAALGLVGGSGGEGISALVCGSLFLAGEALVELGAAPYSAAGRFDVAERLKAI